jgi:hypothetical protein
MAGDSLPLREMTSFPVPPKTEKHERGYRHEAVTIITWPCLQLTSERQFDNIFVKRNADKTGWDGIAKSGASSCPNLLWGPPGLVDKVQ